ncbi:MAG: gamma-glutamyltransferase [Deltaproteobacteria bacterium]|nr:gamma-glutamyltransferase [Deltaproteobacteria bacterium]
MARIPLGGARVVRGEHGMVTSEDVLASRIGADVLERGGNAVDAAVAVAFALSVTHPIAGALGGGGFMLLRTKDGGVHALDFRERAPARATETANLRQLRAGAHGYASAPVPGIVAGLTLSRDRFGTRPLRELVAPSIRLAEEGHPLAARQARVLRRLWRKFEDPAMRESLGNGKRPLAKGAVFRQPDLARTLRAIADRGAAGFYRGPVARAIAEAMQANGGLVTEADLAAYEAKERTPLRIDYRGLDVYTMPPPSMGGVAIAAILRNLESFPAIGAKSELTSAHAFIESARRAYADRRTVGVDPDHAATAEHAERLTRLLSREYHARRAPGIDASHATPSALVAPDGDAPAAPESHDTTHFSVVDAEGTAVACTVTLSAGFGAYVRVPKVGVILSNAMGGFSPRGPNALAPGKRMASSMSPTLIVREGKTVAVLGSPGGDTIPNTVAQVLVHLVDHGMTLDDAVDAPRLHHQHLPDETAFERERPLPREVTDGLEALGHTVRVGPRQGSANCIVLDPLSRSAFGYADPRTGGLAIGPARLRR